MFDLTIRNGTVATASDTFQADIGISGGRIAMIGTRLPAGERDVDARGKLVLPGGVDSHCHVEQLSSTGQMCADDFYSATVSAAFGGTTTIIPFAAQHRGNSILAVVEDYGKRAEEKAVIDYAFHLIVADPSATALREELPAVVRRGITSLKVYMTYDRLRITDDQILEVLAAADWERMLVMVHAENHELITWIAKRLLERGHVAPKFHMTSHHPLAEAEATHRVIQLSRLLDVPMLIVHVSGIEAVQAIRAARAVEARVYAETCPQYLFLTSADADRPGLEGAKWCCSPPPRDEASQTALWQGLKDRTLQVLSSDHAPYRFDASGKLPKGEKTTFKDMANGVPGLQARMPLLFSEGVGKGRITLNEFVALTATNHARLYGIAARKGTIAPGADADIAIWDPEREVTLTASLIKDAVGYTPYEGMRVKGWPQTVISRGRIVVADERLLAARGSGEFVPCGVPEPVQTSHVGGPAAALRALVR